MKQIIAFLISACLLLSKASAQLTPEERIADSVIGWYSAPPKKATAPLTPEGRIFSVKQQDHLNEIIRWMRQTYTPVGGLGTHDKKLFITAGELRPIKRYPPHSYGIDFRVWNVSYTYDGRWLDAKGHFKPVSEEYTRFDVEVNTIPGSWPISWINNDQRYVFTWQADMTGGTGLSADRNKADPRIHPNLYPWITWQSQFKQSILLAPGNQLPVVPVTKGELLQMAEDSYEMLLKELKMTIEQQYGTRDPQANEKAFEARRKTFDKHLENIRALRKKHQATLLEPAVVANYDMGIYHFEMDPDPFVIREAALQSKQYYRVYQYKKDLLEKCKSDQPQWIHVCVPYLTPASGNQQYEMYRSVVEHFNYEYLYQYFFDPEKIKGKAYTPVNEAQLKARLDWYRKKGLETAALSPTVEASSGFLFADDFSQNEAGSKPKGWKSGPSGALSTVTTLKDEGGKWLKLGYNSAVAPIAYPKPLPASMSLSFEVATDAFSSRSGGAVVLYMSTYPLLPTGAEDRSKDGAWLKLTLKAGNEADLLNNNFSGEAKLELHTNPPLFRENYNEGAFYTKTLTEFTSVKKKLRVRLLCKQGEIQLFLNDQSVAVSSKDMKLAYGGACKDCRIPAGLNFRTLTWENMTSNAQETGVYIGQVQIRKE